jgi:DNA-binding MarR family transcriptional regulator
VTVHDKELGTSFNKVGSEATRRNRGLLEMMPKSHFGRVAQSWIRERQDLDLRNFLLAMAIMRMGRMIDHAYSKMCEDRFGITGAEMRVVFALRRSGKPYVLRPTDLFTALLITSGAVTKQIDRLAKKEIVARLPDPTHGGGFLVHLTRDGLKIANKAADLLAAQSILNPITKKLSEEDVEAGSAFCHFVLAELEAMKVMEPGESWEPEKALATEDMGSPASRPKKRRAARRSTLAT